MRFTPEKALALAGYLLGAAFLLALFSPLVVSSYVAELADWQYMREFNIPLVDRPAVYVVPLPSDANFWSHVNPDCSDVRTTAGRGSSEHLLPSKVLSCDVDSHSGEVAFYYSGPETTFRLYYGNPDASSPDISFPDDLSPVYSAPPFDEDDYVIRYCDDGWHGNLRFTRSKVYLVKWDDDCASMVLGSPVPDYASVSMRFRGKGWGEGEIYIFFGDVNISPDYEPDDALLLKVIGDGRIHVQLLIGGEVVAEDVVSRCRDFDVKLIYSGDYYLVYSGNSFLGTLSRRGNYLAFVVADGDTELYMKNLRVYYDTVEVSPSEVSYSSELLTPKSPRIEVSSPGDNTYYNSTVLISYSVDDPNGDLNSVSAYLNDTLLSTQPIFSTSVDLNEGSYTLRITATDSEGLSSTETIHFYVDKTPPELSVDANYSDGTLHLDINVSDVSPTTCYLSIDSSTTEINCAPLDLNVSCNTTLRVIAQDAAGNSTYVDVSTPPCPSGGSPGAGTSGGTAGSSGTVYLSAPQSTPKPVVNITSYPTTSTPSTLSVVPTTNYFVGVLVVLLIIGFFVVRTWI